MSSEISDQDALYRIVFVALCIVLASFLHRLHRSRVVRAVLHIVCTTCITLIALFVARRVTFTVISCVDVILINLSTTILTPYKYVSERSKHLQHVSFCYLHSTAGNGPVARYSHDLSIPSLWHICIHVKMSSAVF